MIQAAILEEVREVMMLYSPTVRFVYRESGERSEWSPYMITPSRGHVEIKSAGPRPIAEVEALELDPIIVRPRGARQEPEREDLLNVISQALHERGVPFHVVDGLIRIELAKPD